jgi:Cu-Zn family superoxide dismutase
MTTPLWATAAIALAFVTGGTAALPGSSHSAPKARGVLQDSTGKEVGTIEAEPAYDGLRIIVKVHDVPGGDLGVHVHSGTSCGSGDGADPFAEAGPHFDPLGRGIHAGLNGPGHAGDLGNISVAADGKGKLDVVQKELTIEPGKMDILGKPVILHSHSDNLTDKPENGGSDGRLACGVLEKA